MKIASISVIAQHPLGLDLHLKNLEWSLDCEHEIFIFTFKKWAFKQKKLKKNIHIIEVDSAPYSFYEFWAYEIKEYLELFVNRFHAFLFTEQDIWFFKKLSAFFYKSIQQNALIFNFLPNYLVIKDHTKKDVYPRIWEGGMIVPAQVLKRSLNQGITFGNHLKAFKKDEKLFKKFESKLITHFCSNMKLSDFIIQNDPYLFDTLFEFQLFCFCYNISFQIFDYASHFNGIEGFAQKYPDVYGNIDRKFLSNFPPSTESKNYSFHHYYKFINIAFMFYVSGVSKMTGDLKEMLATDHVKQEIGRTDLVSQSFRKKVFNISGHAFEWMPNAEYSRFEVFKKLTLDER